MTDAASTARTGTSAKVRVGIDALRDRLSGLVREAAKFGIVGPSALVVDIGLFNILLFFGPLQDKPLTAKAISVAVATTCAYFGNRFWTYRHRARTTFTREYLLFFGLNAVAMLIAVGCVVIPYLASSLKES